jgi:hypothetical protein
MTWQFWAVLGLMALGVVACIAYVQMVREFRQQDEDTWK